MLFLQVHLKYIEKTSCIYRGFFLSVCSISCANAEDRKKIIKYLHTSSKTKILCFLFTNQGNPGTFFVYFQERCKQSFSTCILLSHYWTLSYTFSWHSSSLWSLLTMFSYNLFRYFSRLSKHFISLTPQLSLCSCAKSFSLCSWPALSIYALPRPRIDFLDLLRCPLWRQLQVLPRAVTAGGR